MRDDPGKNGESDSEIDFIKTGYITSRGQLSHV